MTMRGFETVGVRAVIQGLPEYLAGAKAITSANVGISGSLKGLDTVTNGFKLLATAAAGVTAVIGGAAVASAVKYETTLTKIAALTNTSAEDTAKLGAGLLQLARTVPKSPDELGAAAYFALSSGISDVDEALALVTAASKASAAGLGSTADIVDIVTAAINAYGKENLTAADATDILVAAVREGKGEPAEMATALGSLLPLAAALKIPFEDVAAVFASLTNALGGSGGAAQAATQFKGIMSQIISPSKEAKDALAEQEAGVKHLSQQELDLADAHKAVTSAADSYNSAQRSLRNATEDAAQAQRDQNQAVFDARKELLTVAEAEQRLKSLRARGPAQALQEQRAVQALAQARRDLNAEIAKGSKGDTARARLDVAEAEQRLKELRADAPQQALDIQEAEISLAEARNRVGTAAQNQAKKERDAADSVVEAQRNVARSSEDLALAREKELLAQIHTRDAYADLRKEIQEKGIVPALQRINDLFADNQEGLAKLFPDIRGFIGFLSSISSQGDQTAQILEHVHNRLGLTDDAFAKVSKTADFQAKLFKNQVNVALIELGDVALPLVNQGFTGLAKSLPTVSDFFKKGLAGSTVGGDLSAIEKAAFKAGEEVRKIIQFIKDNKDASLIPAGKSFIDGLKDVAEWFIDHKEAIALAFAVFAATNPIWAGILAGGVIITAIGLLGQSIDGLSDPMLRFRAEIDKTMIRMADFASTFFALGLNKVPGLKEFIPTVVPAKGAKEDLAAVEAELARRKKANNDAAEAARQLKQAQEDAMKAGVPYVEFLKSQIEQYIAAGGTKMDEFLRRTLEAYQALPGADQGFIENTKNGLMEAAPAAEALANNLALVRPPEVGDAGRSQLDAATEAGLNLSGTIDAIRPPDVGDAGLQTLGQATEAADNLGQHIDDIDPPDVGDGGKQKLDLAAGAATGLLTRLALIRPPNVGDAGRASIDAATRAAYSLASALGAAAAAASRISIGTAFGTGAVRRAEGGIVTKPEIALIGEGRGPEAVLPLADPRRSREILSSLPPPLIKNLFPVQAFDMGGVLGRASLKQTGSVWDPYAYQTEPFQGFNSGIRSIGGDGGGAGGLVPAMSKQVYATLAPSLVRSMAPPNNSGVTFESMFSGDITVGATSSEVENLVIEQIHAVFARARATTRLTGSLITGSVG